MKTLEQQGNEDVKRAIQFSKLLNNIQTAHFGVPVEKDIMRNLPKKRLTVDEFMGPE